jgi:hypothetical protein
MTPRTIVAVAVGFVLLLAPLAGQGQQARKVPRVGFLTWGGVSGPGVGLARADRVIQ